MRMRHPRALWAGATLATRIALLSTLFGLILTATATGLGVRGLSWQLQKRSITELQAKRALLLHMLSEMPSVQSIAGNSHRFADLRIGHADLHLALVEPATGRSVTDISATAGRSIAVMDDDRNASDEAIEWVAPDQSRLRSIRGTGVLANGETVRYYLSMDLREDASLLGGVLKATLLGLPFLLAVVALGAWGIARSGLAPLVRFNTLAASIGAQSLDQRVSSAGLPRELAELATEFNAMLARIDEGYRRLQEFSGDLAHEIRTPVATLLGRTQVALTHERTPGQLLEVLEGNVGELERIARLVADMLFIASADPAANRLQREDVELHEQARRVADYLSLSAEERGIRIQVSGHARVRADRLLVERAITNLLTNAVRHSSAGSTVSVTLANEPAAATLEVSNQGHGIPPDQLHRIFDRFYRIDPARTRHDGGTGLGLAIVRSIMSAHGGRVEAHSVPKGPTRFTLSFPASGGPRP